jgi:aromatic-L-amino-acid decarboxylase
MQPTTDLLNDAALRAATYLQRARDRRVAPATSAVEALEALAGPLPDEPAQPRDVLDLLDRVGSPATVATNAGRYFGFVNGGALPASMAATWLAAAWDQNASLRVMSPVAATLEDVALE